ncbi:MAG: amidohydrolase family protein [Deltaproteobacteria bacterium]|nr:amidohydrolase family protein [Deltaproteobacteria bacterium]
MERTLVDGALLVTMDPERRMIRNGAVLIEGDSILAVGKSDHVKERFKWRRRLDARNMVIVPGFVDTHIHLSEHIVRSLIPDDAHDWMPNWLMPIYSALTPEDEYYSSMIAFIEMIKTGTTAFCEAGTCFYPDRVAEAMQRVGIRGILGRWTWDLPPGPERMKQTTDQALCANEEMIERIRKLSDERIQAWPLLLGMGTASDRLMIGAKRIADDHGLGLGFMHSSSIPSMETRDKIKPLSHFEELGILDKNLKLTHMVYVEDHEIDLLKKHDVKISHCPTAAMKHSKGISKYAKFPEMVSQGICVSLGADSANSSDHSNMLKLMNLVACIYKDFHMKEMVFPAETVLEMATLRGAEALGMEQKVGSIEVGKRADLVFFNRDHPEWRPLLNVTHNLVYSVSDRSIDTVMISGKIVFDHGRITGLDEEEIYARVEDLSRNLLERSGVSLKQKWPLV